jgi:hypothetical protein
MEKTSSYTVLTVVYFLEDFFYRSRLNKVNTTLNGVVFPIRLVNYKMASKHFIPDSRRKPLFSK